MYERIFETLAQFEPHLEIIRGVAGAAGMVAGAIAKRRVQESILRLNQRQTEFENSTFANTEQGLQLFLETLDRIQFEYSERKRVRLEGLLVSSWIDPRTAEVVFDEISFFRDAVLSFTEAHITILSGLQNGKRTFGELGSDADMTLVVLNELCSRYVFATRSMPTPNSTLQELDRRTPEDQIRMCTYVLNDRGERFFSYICKTQALNS